MPSIFCRFFKVIGEDLDTVVLTVNCIRPSQWKNIQFLWGLFKLFLYCWPNLLFGVVVKCLVPFSVLFVLLLPVPTWSCRPLHAQHHFGGVSAFSGDWGRKSKAITAAFSYHLSLEAPFSTKYHKLLPCLFQKHLEIALLLLFTCAVLIVDLPHFCTHVCTVFLYSFLFIWPSFACRFLVLRWLESS